MKNIKLVTAAIAAVMGIGTVSASSPPFRIQAFTAGDAVTEYPAIVSAENTEELTLGDTNNDNMVDATDASNVLIEYAHLSTGADSIFTDAQKAAADTNSDGKIDSSDASLILIYYSYVSTGGTIKSMKDYLSSVTAVVADIYISNQDVYGFEIAGAVLSLTGKDENGNAVKFNASDVVSGYDADVIGDGTELKWISGKEPIFVKNLPNGKYVLHEVSAPDGFKVATDIVFTIENGDLAGTKSDTVVMFNTKVGQVQDLY